MKRAILPGLLLIGAACFLDAQLPKPGGSSSGGGGGGTPGGSNGTVQYNNSSAFGGITPVSGGILSATSSTAPVYSSALTAGAVVVGGGAGAVPTIQAFTLSGSPWQRGMECNSSTIDLSTVKTNSATQEVTLQSAMSAKFRYWYVMLWESTQAAGTPSLTVAMGQTGVGTDLSGTALALKVGTSNYLWETPRPPAVGSGTYDVVAYFTSGTTMGDGSTGNFTGIVTWEFCGVKRP